jgi:ABC-type Na+ efflux pump permease subunit
LHQTTVHAPKRVLDRQLQRESEPTNHAVKKKRPRKDKFWLFATVSVFILLTAGGATAYLIVRQKSDGVPKTIAKQVEFKAFLPTTSGSDNNTTIDKKSYKYDTQAKVLSYVIYVGGKSRAVVTEQTVPDEFVDIPDAYDKMVNSLGPIWSLESPIGKVSICQTNKLEGQVAVAKSQGTLMFIKADSVLDESTWRKLINGISVRD